MQSTVVPPLKDCFNAFTASEAYVKFLDDIYPKFFPNSDDEGVYLDFRLLGDTPKETIDFYGKYLDFDYFQVIGYKLIPHLECEDPLTDETALLSEKIALTDDNGNFLIQKEVYNLHSLFSEWCKRQYGQSPSEMCSITL